MPQHINPSEPWRPGRPPPGKPAYRLAALGLVLALFAAAALGSYVSGNHVGHLFRLAGVLSAASLCLVCATSLLRRQMPVASAVGLVAGAALAVASWLLMPPAQIPTAQHAPRLIAVAVPVALASYLAILLALRGQRVAPLACVGVGLLLASLAWLLVPTTRGLSLLAAQREAARLEAELAALPSGDATRYLATQDTVDRLLDQYPQFREGLQPAGAAWVARSVAGWEKDLEDLPVGQFRRLKKLHQAYRPWEASLARAERAWWVRTVEAEVHQANQLWEKDPVRAALKLQGAARE